MTSEEIFVILDSCRAGTPFRVPFATPLYPGAEAKLNLLSFENRAFRLVTTYAEFEPGHGYSLEMTETVELAEAEVISRLARVRPREVAVYAP
jgi:hypothetical protein